MYQKYGSWILTGPGKDSLMKKRTVSWIMTAALGVGALTGSMCSANLVFAEEQTEEQNAESEEETEQTDTDDSVMKIGALKGPTAMGMAQLLDDENYEFSIVASPDEIVPMIVQGQVDIAAADSLSGAFYCIHHCLCRQIVFQTSFQNSIQKKFRWSCRNILMRGVHRVYEYFP